MAKIEAVIIPSSVFIKAKNPDVVISQPSAEIGLFDEINQFLRNQWNPGVQHLRPRRRSVNRENLETIASLRRSRATVVVLVDNPEEIELMGTLPKGLFSKVFDVHAFNLDQPNYELYNMIPRVMGIAPDQIVAVVTQLSFAPGDAGIGSFLYKNPYELAMSFNQYGLNVSTELHGGNR